MLKTPAPHKAAVSKFAPGFSAAEFALLFVKISTEDAAREAFQCSVLELTSDQLDRGYSRDAFLSATIAKLFNDPTYRHVYSFLGVVQGIGTAEPPSATRDGPYLTRKYQAARKCFRGPTITGRNLGRTTLTCSPGSLFYGETRL